MMLHHNVILQKTPKLPNSSTLRGVWHVGGRDNLSQKSLIYAEKSYKSNESE